MIGWYGTALGCRRQGPAGYRAPRLQAPAAKWQLKMASMFKRLVIWRLVFLFLELEAYLRVRARVSGRVRLGLGQV